MHGNSRRGQGPPGGGSSSGRGFSKSYMAYSAIFANKQHLLAEGDKIILPNSAFQKLSTMTVEYPLLFRVENTSIPELGKVTHCGVMEFSADEGHCYFPPFMMEQMMIDESSIVQITNVSLPKCTSVKFRPQQIEFIQLETNPRVILEQALRKFTCLTVGDTICIPWLDKHYTLEITELKPANAVSIVETDCVTEFESPVGYDAYLKKQAEAKALANSNKQATSLPAQGGGGLASSAGGGSGADSNKSALASRQLQEGRVVNTTAADSVFKPFSGSGHKLKEDGKTNPSLPNASTATAAVVPPPTIAAKSSSSTSLSSSNSAPVFQSKLGGKFSATKGGNTSAFGGQGHKLSEK